MRGGWGLGFVVVVPLVPQCFGGRSCGPAGQGGAAGYLSCDGLCWQPGQPSGPVLWRLPSGNLCSSLAR